MAIFEAHIWGWLFLGVVVLYLLACLFIRHPIRWKNQAFALPPIQLSFMQLLVSAIEFLLASAVLFVLLPHDKINFSTVLVSYMVAMVAVVATHDPGGIGVLELIILHILAPEDGSPETKAIKVSVLCGLALYRLIYYIAPGIIGGLIYAYHEYYYQRHGGESTVSDVEPDDAVSHIRSEAAELIAHPDHPPQADS